MTCVLRRLVKLSYYTKSLPKWRKPISENIIQLNEHAIKTEIKSLIRKSVEKTLITLLNE